uniref:electron transport complex subunit RsxC n=1 Tax=uncultured Cardiobacterium sp. TaxID=417619 RepID=UPI0026088311
MIKKLLACLLPPKNHFHGGLHITPPRHKSMSTGAPSREAALSAEYAISLRQRDGSAYLAKVAPGERVLRGQLLAEPVNSQDAPIHAPTSGTIRAIEPRPEMHPANQPVPHLILESDGKDEAVPPLPALDPETTDADTLRERIAACGIVGLGGAGFPTARKLGHPANTLVINAAECEPYITCDDLQIRENAADIINGAQIAAKILGAEHIHFGIEDDKPQAIAALERAAADLNDPRIQISSVPTRYPSGNARQLFELLLGVRVPADQHASDYGLICHNSGTMKAVYDAVIRGEPLTERYTTISGEGVKQPQVLRIRTGAPARDLINQAGGETGDNRYIIGGPMMGYQITSADTPLQKTGNSLLLLPAIEPAEESPCIRCSRCADACPMELLPQQLLWYSQSDEHKRLKQYRLFDCIECGICAAVCPSAIPLVQYYRHSKGAIRAADDKTRAAEHARARHEARTARLEREAAERQAQMDARRAKLQQNPAADKPERYTPAKPAVAASPTMMPPPPVEGSRQSSAASDDKTAAIEAAKARAAARRAERLAAQNSEAKTPANLPPSPCGGGDGGGVRPHTADANTATDVGRPFMADNNIGHECPTYNPVTTVPAPHQLPSDPGKTAAIEAAKARAAARRAERLAAQNEKAETSTAPASRTEVLPPSQDAPASAAGEGWG